jgi:hypothetical protein
MALRHVTLIAALALTLAGLVTPTPAPAQPATPANVQAQINEHLRNYPGGVQTGPTEISYDNGVFVMTFVRSEPATAGIPDCPSGWFCFYDYVNFGYPRGKLSACGWQDLARWGWQNRTESAHYRMSTGSVAFINHADGYTHHNFDVAVFGVGTSQPTIADTSPYRNTTDHVQRYC